MKVLMVCLGNICRSPLAEGILRKLANDKGLDLTVDSCGTADYHVGESPDSRSTQVASENGIDISSLTGRQFKASDFESFDFILAMDEKNLSDILSKSKYAENSTKAKLMLSYLPEVADKNVFDPYYGSISDFEAVYTQLHRACTNFIDKEII
jgi:protein-tyrosine phosphatase